MMSGVGSESMQVSNLIDKAETDDSNEEDGSIMDEGGKLVQKESQRKNLSDQDQGDVMELHLLIAEALHLPMLSSPW